MLLELEAWFRTKGELAAESLLEAFDELLTLHRFKVAALLRKTLLSTDHREHVLLGAAPRAQPQADARERDAPTVARRGAALL
jgi:hypothetical protein